MDPEDIAKRFNEKYYGALQEKDNEHYWRKLEERKIDASAFSQDVYIQKLKSVIMQHEMTIEEQSKRIENLESILDEYDIGY